MYPFERFSERAKHVLTLAQEEAERSHHSYIGTEHMLLGILRENDGIGGQTLNNLGIDTGRVRAAIESVLGSNPRIIVQQIIPTSRVKKVIEISFEEARRMGNNYVGTHHMLLGLLIEGEGIGAHVLIDLGAAEAPVRAEIQRLLPGGEEDEPGAKPKPAGFQVGDRVLVHDPDPPYRLWEGRVSTVEEPNYDISVPGRPDGELMTAEAKRIHPVPMSWTRDCRFCREG
jgi:ATP-dependent Clp protease ATP-binding subunit ClpA